ncbi:MAG: OsmC family protein [Rhodobacteraceae bacterium]|nr:OsmC family protein [Paracoccaceae bacterium]
MADHGATIEWRDDGAGFTTGRYSRAHTWVFDGGAQVVASSSPHNVPLPFSDAGAVDPEEAFVAAIASCHMLWFLGLAAAKKIAVTGYTDHAVGTQETGADGKAWISVVRLRPEITFAGEVAPDVVAALHDAAHERCFIANSVKTEIIVEQV